MTPEGFKNSYDIEKLDQYIARKKVQSVVVIRGGFFSFCSLQRLQLH